MAGCCRSVQAQGLGPLARPSRGSAAAAATPPRRSFQVTCRRRERGDKEFARYHVTVVTPPPTHLGVHCLPPVRAASAIDWKHIALSRRSPFAQRIANPVYGDVFYFFAFTHASPELSQNTQCGETVTVKGQPYIVSGVTYQYQLRRGKYEARQNRLDVQSSGRYVLNLYLDQLLEGS